LGPNIDSDAVTQSLAMLCMPWKWRTLRRGPNSKALEQSLQRLYGVPYARTIDSGRSALLIALRALNISKGDDVLVQAYTCMVVVNAIRRAGASPIFVDIRDDLTIDPVDVVAKITPRTKALIIQHTFGAPAQTDPLIAIAKKHGIATIEDCAHSMDTDVTPPPGTQADIAMLSFGSDKPISSVRGGAIITSDPAIEKRIDSLMETLPDLSLLMVVRLLFQPPLFALGRATYDLLGFGKGVFLLMKTFHVAPRTITQREKQGEPDGFSPSRFPNALAVLALKQVNTLPQKNEHRKKIARIYAQTLHPSIRQPHRAVGSPLLRYIVLVEYPHKVAQRAKSKSIQLGDWYQTVIAPGDSNMRAAGYIAGTCPRAESFALRSINLPTDLHISHADAERIAVCMNSLV